MLKMDFQIKQARGIALFLFLFFLASCQSLYLNTLEKVGIEKREVLHSRIIKAQQSQTDAKEQFVDALTKLKQLTQFEGGQLERTYRAVEKSYRKTETRAVEVSSRIQEMDKVALILFQEWETELEQYQSKKFKAQSTSLLAKTRADYGVMLKAMWTAESAMSPVLKSMHDQVLFLKHHLNAQALGHLDSEVANIEKQVSVLIQDMNKSIQSADKFIQTLEKI
jgi:Protein of unknown function (DUF2959)